MRRIDEANEGNYLNGIEDGVGCVEIWERLSEARDEAENKAEADED